MFGKKTSPHRRLKRSLLKLPPKNYMMASGKTTMALKTRKALDKMGIDDAKKRRRIHRIVQQRIFGKDKTGRDFARTSFQLGLANAAIKAGRPERGMPRLTTALSVLSRELGGQAKLDEFMALFSSYFVRLKPRKKK